MNTSSLFLRRCLSLALSLAVGSVVAAETSPSELPTRVVQPREVALTLPAEGVVEALSQAVVAAQVAGRVTEMRVDAGQAVKKGEVMLRLDVRQLHRRDCLRPGLAFSWSWSWGDEPAGSISIFTSADSIRLSYSFVFL